MVEKASSPTSPPSSPRWSPNTKLILGLTAIFILGALVFTFHTLIVPILMAFIVAYLLHPLVTRMTRNTPLSWAVAVNIIYLIFVIVLVGLLVWGGFGLVGQIQNLITSIQKYATDLPGFIESLSHNVTMIGPFRIDFSTIDWMTIGQEILSYVQPILGNVGGLVGSLAGSAVSILGWTAFVVIVSYFFLLESGEFRNQIIHIEIPNYAEDYRRLSAKLGRIWNAFLRGQIIIFFSKFLAYTVILGIMGVHYAIPVALIAGFASFLPYIGPTITWIVLGLITLFQGGNIFGLAPVWYMLISIGAALIIDQAFDNLVAPRIMAQTLRVHPAFVLIAAIIAARLLGIIGIVLAAPLLASIQLLGRYMMRKMLDLDPWATETTQLPGPRSPRWLRKLKYWWRRRIGKDATPEPAADSLISKDTKK
jgi:predicted PurR-regulated permease PerM